MILVFVKWLTSRFFLIDNYCKRCGRKTEPYTIADDDLYLAIIPDGKEVCFRCLHREAIRSGMSPVWRIRSE